MTALPVVVLISGRGSNLRALLDATTRGDLPVDIRAVISNRPAAGGLQFAADAGITTDVIDHTHYADRASFDAALQTCIDGYQPALVILAGFMRILTADFVAHYRGRLVNIHPSLLPAYPGLDTHRRALEAGDQEHGASVHFVTADMDGGPVIMQARVRIEPGDTPEQLAARVLEQEHQLYPAVIRQFASNRLMLDAEGQVRLDGELLSQPQQLDASPSSERVTP